jgi:hypothetical protein
MTTPPSPAASGRGTCPICRRPVDPRYRPFCSVRCANVDLGRWFGESYRVPTEERDEEPGGQDDGP